MTAHGPISDDEFEKQITALVSRKLATVQTRQAPDSTGALMVRAVLVGCTYESPLGCGGIWWTIGTNRFEQIGLSMAMMSGLQEPAAHVPFDEEGEDDG